MFVFLICLLGLAAQYHKLMQQKPIEDVGDDDVFMVITLYLLCIILKNKSTAPRLSRSNIRLHFTDMMVVNVTRSTIS